jgi:hypothetical protein
MLGSSNDAVFNLRLPYNERDKILPPGEGYWCRHGVALRVKIAMPNDDDLPLIEDGTTQNPEDLQYHKNGQITVNGE